MTDVQIEERKLDEGFSIVIDDTPAMIRMAYDPTQIGEDAALDLLRLAIPRIPQAVTVCRRRSTL